MYTRLTVFFPAAVFGFGVRRAISGVVAGTNRPAGEASLFGAGDVDMYLVKMDAGGNAPSEPMK